MKMRAGHLLTVRVAVGGATEVQPYQDDDLSGSVLEIALEQIDSTSADIQKELLALVRGLQWNNQRLAFPGEIDLVFIDTMFLHSN